MLITTQQENRDFPTAWVSTVKSLKSDPSPFDAIPNPEYYRSLAGSPFDSSDSDSSSDCDDDAMSLGSSDLSSTIREDPISKDISLVSEGPNTLMESNALGLVFNSQEDVFATEAVATLAQQAEGLRAPQNHQDDRSYGRPNQKYNAQQVYVAFQSDGPTDETLVCRFPQDIGLWSDVSDSSGPKVSKSNREAIPADRKDVSFQVFQGLYESPFEKAHSLGDGYDQPDTYDLDHNLRAPRMKPISLPEEQEYDEDLLYSGPALGGWLTGTLDGIPKTMLPGFSCLDIGLPVPFAMED
jgi:hypothetical protein